MRAALFAFLRVIGSPLLRRATGFAPLAGRTDFAGRAGIAVRVGLAGRAVRGTVLPYARMATGLLCCAFDVACALPLPWRAAKHMLHALALFVCGLHPFKPDQRNAGCGCAFFEGPEAKPFVQPQIAFALCACKKYTAGWA